MLKPLTTDIEALKTLDERLRWLSAWTIHHANHVRASDDGIKVDGGGRVYSAGPAGVHVFDPAGVLVAVLVIGLALRLLWQSVEVLMDRTSTDAEARIRAESVAGSSRSERRPG